jgi:hypothetical protein
MSIMPNRPHRNGASRRRDDAPRGRPPASAAAPDVMAGAPTPPHELDADPAGRRLFEADDGSWVAWVAGKSTWGSGGYGLGMVVAIHFARADAPEQALREMLVARGRVEGLFDDELRELLASATPIDRSATPRSEPRRPRRGRDW